MSFSYHLARYRWLREYYRDTHLRADLAVCPLKDAQGTTIGYLEVAQLKEGRLHLSGWVLAQQISFRLGDMHILRSPRDEREDVAQALGCDKHVGFKASLPFVDAPLLIEWVKDGKTGSVSHDLKASRALVRANRRVKRQFLRDVIPRLPMILAGLMRKDPDLPRRIKSAFRLGLTPAEGLLDAAFLAQEKAAPLSAEPTRPPPPGQACIILPIYNAFDLLPETLDRLAAHTDLPCDVIVIEDASPDPRVRPFLRDWASRDHGDLHITLLENDSNLGFIGSVNRGFDHALAHGEGPVILLNGDAMVPAGWCSRLLAPLADLQVASATPLSNDAEIFGAPVLCRPTILAAGQSDQIDAALAARIAPDAPRVIAPTGVGFCMALGRHWLQDLGGFDTIFGRGYGEEVDWCRRASGRGGQHVAVPNLFVEHRGGASFGDEKPALVQAHNAIIATRYPGYDRLVQEFIRADPLRTPRLVAALAWADSQPDVTEIPVYIAHSMGGGAELYLQAQVQAAPVSLVLRFGGASRCRIEFTCSAGRMIAATEDLALVLRLLETVSKRRIIYSCAVGDPDMITLAGFIAQLAQTAPLDMLFHDYLPLSPSYTLLDSDGVYRGVLALGTADRAHRYTPASGDTLSLQDWRALWGEVVAAAERLVVFSASSARIVAEAYPQAKRKIAVVAHKSLQDLPPLPRPEGPRIVIGVLGAIGPQKGAAVVAALAQRLATEPDRGLALIGRMAPGFPLGRQVPVHGAYAIEDIPALAARYGITHWLIPSIWPETFSFTVHECLATGLPTMAFDLGAQGDAVRVAENGILLPWEAGQRAPDQLAALVLQALE